MFNIHGTNTIIKHRIVDADKMIAAGFVRNDAAGSWLLVRPLTCKSDFWFEIWGDGDDEFCIECLYTETSKPFITPHTTKKMVAELKRLENFGIVYDVPKDIKAVFLSVQCND